MFQHKHSSEQSAVEQVKKGDAWAAVVIGEDFTEDLFKRLSNHSSSIIKGSTIFLHMDVTSKLAHVVHDIHMFFTYIPVCNIIHVYECSGGGCQPFFHFADTQISAVIENNTAYAFEVCLFTDNYTCMCIYT